PECARRAGSGGYVDADNFRQGMRRTGEKRIGFAGLGENGRVAALSPHQKVIFHPRGGGRPATPFFLHALFRGICLDKAHPLINPKQPPAKAAFFGFFVGNAFRCRLALRPGRYASVVPDGGFWSLAGTLPDASTRHVRAHAVTGHADGARSAV